MLSQRLPVPESPETRNAPENPEMRVFRPESDSGSPARLRNFRLAAGLLFFLMFGASIFMYRTRPVVSEFRVRSTTGVVEFVDAGRNLIRGAHPGILFESNPVKEGISDLSIRLDEKSRGAKSVSFSLWDYSAEDGDVVQLLYDGLPLGGPVKLGHIPVTLQCPPGGTLTIRVLDPGRLSLCSYGFYLYGTGATVLNMQARERECTVRLLPPL